MRGSEELEVRGSWQKCRQKGGLRLLASILRGLRKYGRDSVREGDKKTKGKRYVRGRSTLGRSFTIENGKYWRRRWGSQRKGRKQVTRLRRETEGAGRKGLGKLHPTVVTSDGNGTPLPQLLVNSRLMTKRRVLAAARKVKSEVRTTQNLLLLYEKVKKKNMGGCDIQAGEGKRGS